jgi:tetratricopeptide (TPR) repeat protein
MDASMRQLRKPRARPFAGTLPSVPRNLCRWLRYAGNPCRWHGARLLPEQEVDMRASKIVLGLLACWAAGHSAGAATAKHLTHKGERYLIRGESADAESAARMALVQDPQSARAHYVLAAALRSEGRPDDAIAQYRQALAIYPPKDTAQRAQALYGLALAADDKGDKSEAISAWQNYIDFDGTNPKAAPSIEIARWRLENWQTCRW